jgi:hypothetical protein
MGGKKIERNGDIKNGRKWKEKVSQKSTESKTS